MRNSSKGRAFKERYTYSRPEKALIALGVLLSLFMSYTYFADISLRRLFFPTAEERLLSTPIGVSVKVRGAALRQRANDLGFNGLDAEASLFPSDTIITGADSSVTLELKDGKKIEIAPNSLVKLSFGSDFADTGLVHIEVIQGSAKPTVEKQVVQAPKETPKPIPLAIVSVTPPAKTSLPFSTEEYYKRSKSVTLSFRANRAPSAPLVARVYLPSEKNRRELSAVTAQVQGTEGSAVFNFNSPGSYEWEVQDADGTALAKSDFQLTGKLNLIQVLPTLNSTNRLEGAATKKSFDGFRLRWKPVDGPGKYVVKIFKSKSEQPLLEKEIATNELVLNKNKLLLGRLFYSVEKDLSHGFVALSGKHPFGFEFLPPELTAPGENTAFNAARLKDNNNLIFFTWTKTNYTTAYEFEMSEDPNFTTVVLRRSIRDNYVSFAPPASSRFFWRVRSLSNGLWSDFSETRSLTVAR